MYKLIGNMLLSIGLAINNVARLFSKAGMRCMDIGVDNKKYKIMESENERKDRIIACTVRKGGCEVQTGPFRRADCMDDGSSSDMAYGVGE